MITKIISGGQTGADRAALDVALALGIPCGGYCPKGRKAEDGPIPDHYPLTELPTADYPSRTRANVAAADATLLLVVTPSPELFLVPADQWLTGGTKLTLDVCVASGKRWRIARLDNDHSAANIRRWLAGPHFAGERTLNVAGPRESRCPGVYEAARAFLREVFTV